MKNSPLLLPGILNLIGKRWLILFIFCTHTLNAQEIIFSDNFEDKIIRPAWQNISGNWHIGDVDEMRIAPAENGYQYVLCSGGPGFTGSNLIRLNIDLPDPASTTKIKLSFSYYILANAPGTIVRAEFHKKGQEDTLKGGIWQTDLLTKRRWIVIEKTLDIPTGANVFSIDFYGLESSGKTTRIVCFDAVSISLVKAESSIQPKRNQ